MPRRIIRIGSGSGAIGTEATVEANALKNPPANPSMARAIIPMQGNLFISYCSFSVLDRGLIEALVSDDLL